MALPEIWRSEYPFSPHFQELEGGVRQHYVDEGQGPVLLFVHGNPTWSFAWRRFLTGFASTHRVIAVDHVGCGLSDKPTDYPYVLDRHVANLTALIKRLDLREITLVGHDWGGCIGMGAAVAQPNRFARFVLMNTAAFRSRRIPLRIAVCRWPVLGALGVRGLNLFSRAALTMAVERPLSPVARAGFLAPYDSWAHRVAVHRFVEDIPQHPGHPSYDRLVQIEQGLALFQQRPMLLPWGERDWCFTTAFLDEFRQRFPNATVLRYPNCGHYLFEDAHEQLIPALREWLDKTPV